VRVEDNYRGARRAPGRLSRGETILRPAAPHVPAATTGASRSPAIRAEPVMQPKMSVAGASGGMSLATGRPILVITTGVRYFRTSSITCGERGR
jgi:hypothetical protein